MPNYAELFKLMSKLPKGSQAAQELVAAEMAAREAAQKAAYTVKSTKSDVGKEALAKAKQTLITPEQQAKLEAEMRERGKKKFLKPSKEKRVMYHATPGDISKFTPGAADAIFLSDNPYAAQHFGELREHEAILDLAKEIEKNPQTKRDLLIPIIDQAIADGRLGTPENTKGLVKTTRQQHIDQALQKQLGNQLGVAGYGKELTEELQGRMPSSLNIMPLHVRTENPFDYENPKHVKAVMDRVKEIIGEEGYSRDRMSSGDWSAIEDETVQEAIKNLGFDGFYIEEGGNKNLGIYDPRRIKSATGNRGTYDITESDITKKHGGLAHMAGGGVPEKRDVSQLFPINPELRGEPVTRTRAGVPVQDTNVLSGALQGLGETLLGAGRGATEMGLGAPADILNMLDLPKLMTGESYQIPYGLEYFKEKLPLAPQTQTGQVAQQLGEFLPISPEQPVKAAVSGAKKVGKALAPTMADMLEAELKARGMMMGVAPEGKLSKEEYSRMMREKYAAQNLAKEEKKVTAADLKPHEVKVPADELGFYSPAEKAAANLKRNIGTGEAFLSDLKKAPDVGETDLVHTGLENWLKGKKTVSKQEIQDYMKQNRVGLVKEELKAGEGSAEELRFPRLGEVIDDHDYINMMADDYANDWDSMGWRSRDEIRQEILNQRSPAEAEELINSGYIDDLVDDEVNKLSYQLASDQYYDNPYRSWTNDAGYEITGNDDVGYMVRDPRGRDITPRNGAYDFETAEGAAMMDAQERGIYAEGGTQYHDYQLEGPSSNYREHLTRLDRDKGRGDLQKEIDEVRRAMDDPLDQEQYNSLSRRYEELKDELSHHHKPYESSHWPGTDVVSHSRTQDRVDLDGKEILFADEIQSDWHQDGAEFGYANKETRQKYKDLMKERSGLAVDFTETRDSLDSLLQEAGYTARQASITNAPEDIEKAAQSQRKLDAATAKSKELADQIDQINMQLSDFERSVPDAPFKKDWVEKELKKLLKIAAEEGKDRLAISRWQEQLKRWGTDSIAFSRLPGTIDGNKVFNVVASKGRKLKPSDFDDTITPEDIFYLNTLRNNDQRITTKSELRKIIKTDMASGWSNAHVDRITNKVWDQMNGLDVEGVGALDPRKEGFKATYGKSFIETMNKLAKKLGAKTGTTRISAGYGEEIEVPYIEVSGKAKSSAIKGQPYKVGGAVMAKGGAINLDDVIAQALQQRHMADGGAVNLDDVVGQALRSRGMAEGGGAWQNIINSAYNTNPDMKDGGSFEQAPAFADGGGVWKQLVKGATNA